MSKSHHKSVCHEKRVTHTHSVSLQTVNTQIVRCVSEIVGRKNKESKNRFSFARLASCCFSAVLNNSEQEDRRRPCLLFFSSAPCSITAIHAAPSAATLKHLSQTTTQTIARPPPHTHFPFVLITSRVFKCARSPTVPSIVSPLLIGNAGRIMENYPVYKKPLKSRGAPLPNDTESNYRMFQHPVHRKGSVSRATLHAHETHLVQITISCRSAVKTPLSLSRLFSVLCVTAVTLYQPRIEEQRGISCMQTCFCFGFAGAARPEFPAAQVTHT